MALEVGSTILFRQSDMHVDDGTIMTGTIADPPNGKYLRIAVAQNAIHFVQTENAKQFGYEIGNVALTIDAFHCGKMAEFYQLGMVRMRAKAGKKFYCVSLEGEKQNRWFSEDELFIEDVRSEPATGSLFFSTS